MWTIPKAAEPSNRFSLCEVKMTQPIEFEALKVEATAENITIPALPVRICQVFMGPAALFDRLKERPVWIVAMAGLVLLGIAQYVLTPDSLRSAAIEAYLPEGANFEIRIGGSGTTPSNAQETPDMGSSLPGILGIVIATPVIIAIVAFLLLIAFNVVLGGEATYRQLYSAVTHGFYIPTLGGFVVLGLAFLGSNEVILSPALLLPGLGDGYWARLLGMISVFAVWACVVLGIAVSRIYPGRSPVGATIYLLVLYLGQAAIIAAFIGLLGGVVGSRELRL